MKRTQARLGVLLSLVALSVALTAAPLLAAQSDNEIPGVPLPPSPVTGSLSDIGTVAQQDYDDVYYVVLARNDKLTVSMTGDAGTDFDLQLFRPGTPAGDPEDLDPDRYVVQASSKKNTSSEEFWYPASREGTYSVDVVNFRGKGDYRLEWKIERLPEPGLVTQAPATIAWGEGATLQGAAEFAGAPLKDNPVIVQGRTAGTSAWKNLNWGGSERTPPKLRTSSAGAFSYTVKPTKRMEYRAVVWPTEKTGWVDGVEHAVSPRPYLSTPSAPSSVKAKAAFSVSGYLQPKHKVGDKDVKLIFYRWDKSDREWDKVKTVSAINKASTKYPTKTRYYARTTLPSKGSWKVEARIAGDAIHTEKTSGADKLTVK